MTMAEFPLPSLMHSGMVGAMAHVSGTQEIREVGDVRDLGTSFDPTKLPFKLSLAQVGETYGLENPKMVRVTMATGGS